MDTSFNESSLDSEMIYKRSVVENVKCESRLDYPVQSLNKKDRFSDMQKRSFEERKFSMENNS